MKTPSDALNRVYQYLTQVDLIGTAGMSGDLCKGFRPDRSGDSRLEDAVLNSLPFDGAQFQNGVINLNLYVQDVSFLINGVEMIVPGEERLEYISSKAIALVADVTGNDYHLEVQNIDTIAQPETNEHYSNIRLAFKFFSLD